MVKFAEIVAMFAGTELTCAVPPFPPDQLPALLFQSVLAVPVHVPAMTELVPSMPAPAMNLTNQRLAWRVAVARRDARVIKVLFFMGFLVVGTLRQESRRRKKAHFRRAYRGSVVAWLRNTGWNCLPAATG